MLFIQTKKKMTTADDLLRNLVKTPGTWVKLQRQEVGDVEAAFKLAIEYEGVHIKAVNGSVWLCFDLSDIEPLREVPATSREDHTDVILAVLEIWDNDDWPFSLDSIANTYTQDTWLHLLSARGMRQVIKKYLATATLMNPFCLNAAGKIPLDVASDTHTHTFLQQHGQTVIQHRQEECQLRMEAIRNQVDELKRDINELDGLQKRHSVCWFPSWLRWFF